MRLSALLRVLASCVALLLTLAFAGCSQTEPSHGDTESAPRLPQDHDFRVAQRVLLVGDAGEPRVRGCGQEASCEPVLQVMEHWAKKRPDGNKPFIVFLGDNIYPGGLPDETNKKRRLRAEAKLNAQTRVLVNSQTQGVFIPGNHDWGGTFGSYHENWTNQYEFLKQAARQQEAAHGQPYLIIPEMRSGCPWPTRIDKAELEGVTIVVLDSQWWLTPDNMQDVDECPRANAQEIASAETRVVGKLTEILKAAGHNQIIVATHHPMATHGLHGGWYRYFAQDIRSSKYQKMIKAYQKAYYDSGVRPLIHAAGHDHALQVLKGADDSGEGYAAAKYNLVSGAGSAAKLQSVGRGDDTLFADSNTGFMVVDVMHNGEVFLQVVEPNRSDESNLEGTIVFAVQLK